MLTAAKLWVLAPLCRLLQCACLCGFLLLPALSSHSLSSHSLSSHSLSSHSLAQTSLDGASQEEEPVQKTEVLQKKEALQKTGALQKTEVRVEEPLPKDLVTPPEPLPEGSEDLKPLPQEPGAVEAGDEPTDLVAAKDELLTTVQQWARAWGEQEVESYLTFYAESFETPEEMARGEWEMQRRERLQAPTFIEVTIEDPKVQSLSQSSGRVEFIQRYTSDRYSDTVRKTLQLTRARERWRILREEAEVLEGG